VSPLEFGVDGPFVLVGSRGEGLLLLLLVVVVGHGGRSEVNCWRGWLLLLVVAADGELGGSIVGLLLLRAFFSPLSAKKGCLEEGERLMCLLVLDSE